MRKFITRTLNKLSRDNKGSVVVFVVFGLTILFAGGLYSVMNYYVDAINGVVTLDDAGYNLQMWFWNYGLLVLIFIGVSVWFISTLQKKRYAEY